MWSRGRGALALSHHSVAWCSDWRAQGNLEANVRGQKAYYDKKASDREYQIGAKVLYFNFTKPVGVSKKFLPNWSGPYEIVGKLSPVAYRIRVSRPNKAPMYKWVHVNQIKPFEPFPLQRGEPPNSPLTMHALTGDNSP